jgi:hypothetical protein
MVLNDLTRSELEELAWRAGIAYTTLNQIRLHLRRPSPRTAAALETAAAEMGIDLPRAVLVWGIWHVERRKRGRIRKPKLLSEDETA